MSEIITVGLSPKLSLMQSTEFGSMGSKPTFRFS